MSGVELGTSGEDHLEASDHTGDSPQAIAPDALRMSSDLLPAVTANPDRADGFDTHGASNAADSQAFAAGSSTAHYRLTGGLAGAPQIGAHYEQQMDAMRSMTIKGESGLSDAERQLLAPIQAGIVHMTAEAGISPIIIQDRLLLPEDRYRGFRDPNDYKKGVTLMSGGAEPAGESVFFPHAGVLYMQDDDVIKSAHRLASGTVMSGAVQWVKPHLLPEEKRFDPKAVEIGFSATTGYVRKGLTSQPGINTIVTDMTTHRALRNAGMNRERIVANNSTVAALGSAVVMHTAEYHGASPLAVENKLTEGFFTGSTEGISLVREALGTGNETFLALTGRENESDLAGGVVDTLGLSRWEKYITAAAADTTKLYDWRQ